MSDNVTLDEMLKSIEAVKELYPGKIPTRLLEEHLKETSNEHALNGNVKSNGPKSEYIIWGNKNSTCLIFGQLNDNEFSESGVFWNSILNNGMKMDNSTVCCLSAFSAIPIDLVSYKFILSLGDNSRRLLEDKFLIKLTCSNLYKRDGIVIMPTYEINQVNNDKNIKRIFWNDLQNFLKEIC